MASTMTMGFGRGDVQLLEAQPKSITAELCRTIGVVVPGVTHRWLCSSAAWTTTTPERAACSATARATLPCFRTCSRKGSKLSGVHHWFDVGEPLLSSLSPGPQFGKGCAAHQPLVSGLGRPGP